MTMPGGASDKLGNTYEGLWTLFCLVDVMDERSDAIEPESIHLEPPGEEGKGIEFYVTKDGIREFHQVKRQITGEGRWTIGALSKILTNFAEKLKQPGTKCVFVSSHSAYQMDELASRAVSAASFNNFRSGFLNAKKHAKSFDELRKIWKGLSDEACFEALKKIEFRTCDEKTLRNALEGSMNALVEGNSATVIDVLCQLVMNSVHRELTAHDVWTHLEKQDLKRRDWANDKHVLALLTAANHRYRHHLNASRIRRKLIQRPEVQNLASTLIDDNSCRGVIVTGQPGIGKSIAILEIINALIEREVPYLVFRVDRLTPTILPDKVGEQIGLPGSPLHVIASVAKGKKCALIIDQLDAVSLTSGRNPDFFECVSEIIAQGQLYSHVRLILGCRKFDLENDHRLRQLSTSLSIKPEEITNFSDEIVRETLSESNIDADVLTPNEMKLLSIPIHLKLLTDAQEPSLDSPSFGTVNNLYDIFWRQKQVEISRRNNFRLEWTNVIDNLCDFMSRNCVLNAPEETLDAYLLDAELMVSENVLVRDGRQYSFFHETFFDYAYARRFHAEKRGLLEFLTTDEQHLFRRSQVRQILVYERNRADKDSYLKDLRAVINDCRVRFHLKRVVFDILKDLKDPMEEEWQVLENFFQEKLHALEHVFYVLRGSVPWFELLDKLGIIGDWLSSTDDLFCNRAMNLLSAIQKFLPDRVAELLRGYIGVSQKWNERLVYIVESANVAAGRDFFDFCLQLLDKGLLDDLKRPGIINSDFWSIFYVLPKQRPEWACELMNHYFNRRLKVSLKDGEDNPFLRHIPQSQFWPQFASTCSKLAPLAFVENLLPFFMRVLELTALKDGNPPWQDLVFPWREFSGRRDEHDPLLAAMENALSHVASHYPERFAVIAEQLGESSFETIQFLLVRSYTANGVRFADEACDYLCDETYRLKTGYVTEPHWATRQLLEAVTPHCTQERMERLQSTLLDYYPKFEKTITGPRRHGYAQFVLLEGIVPSRRSPAVLKRLRELERKFGPSILKPRPSVKTLIPASPVPAAAAEKMTDKQWVQALSKYAAENMDWLSDGGVGGIEELSQVLREQTEKDPQRFVKLMESFPDDVNPEYFSAILRGLTAAVKDTDLIIRAVNCCHKLPSQPCGLPIISAITKNASTSVPRDLLDILSWYATQHPDPDKELWLKEETGGIEYYGGRILQAGINSVRGSAAEAIAAILNYHPEILQQLVPTLESMVHDKSLAVRACVAAPLTIMLNYNRDLAIGFFKKLTSSDDDRLLGTQHVDNFLYYALMTHFHSLKPTLGWMLTSEIESVRKVGAVRSCVASLQIRAARPLASQCLIGSVVERTAAAEIFAANAKWYDAASFCHRALERLFNDADEDVAKTAARCFGRFSGDQLGNHIPLVEKFIESPAFQVHSLSLMDALENTTAKLPEVTCRICELFLEQVGTDAASPMSYKSWVASIIGKLVIRIYSQNANVVLQKRCLDMIDRMSEMQVYGIDKVFQLFDR